MESQNIAEEQKSQEFQVEPTNWVQSLKQALNKNQQLQYSKYFSISLYDAQNEETISDYLRLELIIEKNIDLNFHNGQPSQYYTKPYLVVCIDQRSDIGKLIHENKAKSIQLCWFFTLTREKIRIKSQLEILSYLDEITANRFLVEQVWNQLSDEERLVYKRPLPGLDKQEIKDELQHYEPQIEDLIPRNFKVVKLICHDFDHFMMAPPPVIADQRRKPQQYESLAQPFKKDRRFRHQFDENTQKWSTKEVNP